MSVVAGLLDGGRWSACFGMSYRDLYLHDIVSRRYIVGRDGHEMRSVVGAGGIARGRNQIAAAFLDAVDAEWLWFVDTDMGFDPDTVDRLVDAADPAERPIVGALCFQLKRQQSGRFYAERFRIAPTTLEYVEVDGETGFRPIVPYQRDAVMRVAGTGAACLLIHRDVLGKLRADQGDQWFSPVTHPTADHGKSVTFSEDLSFCVRCADADIPIHVDTSIKTTHEKGGVFLDEDTYDEQELLFDAIRASHGGES